MNNLHEVLALILDSGRGFRRLDSRKSYPASLKQLNGQRVIDWTLSALKTLKVNDITFLGGYHVEKVVLQHPEFRYMFHPGWEEEGECSGLKKCLNAINQSIVIIPGLSIIRSSALIKTAAEFPKTINFSFSKQDPETCLLAYIPKNHIPRIKKITSAICAENPGASLTDLYYDLKKKKPDLTKKINLENDATSIANRADLAHFILGTKAQTLARLKQVVSHGFIEDQYVFLVKEWQSNPNIILSTISQKFMQDEYIIIRSSTQSEDSWHNSNAGKFISILNIHPHQQGKLKKCIEKVINSYPKQNLLNQEVLIQPQLTSVSLSGVIFTRDLNTGAPYYTINYDKSTKTDSITSGSAANHECITMHRETNISDEAPAWLHRLIESTREIEELLCYDCLDIEFAVSTDQSIHIFQVRPLVATSSLKSADDQDISEELERIKQFFNAHQNKMPHLFGNRTFFGNMPDWNPAEMIGSHPKPLAYSLYNTLITLETWKKARVLIGYQDIPECPLMVNFCGQPYIDIRSSLNSFLPASLDKNISEKIINFQLNKLENNTHLHDKIEFSISITCLSFDFNENIDELKKSGFSKSERNIIFDSFSQLTNNIIKSQSYSIEKLTNEISHLSESRDLLQQVTKGSNIDLILIYMLHVHQALKKHGVLPFSILARYGFISMSILNSLKGRIFKDNDEYDNFLAGIPTVASEISSEIHKVRNSQNRENHFLNQYGHLRPGTYDICSLSYKERPDLYIRNTNPISNSERNIIDPTAFFNRNKLSIKALLQEYNFEISFNQLTSFIIKAIIAREKAKFEFTKSISMLLEAINRIGELVGISRSDLAFLTIEDFLQSATASRSAAWSSELAKKINHNKKRFKLTESIKLPGLICSSKDITFFKLETSKPNFITSKTTVSSVKKLNGNPPHNPKELKNKIILIENADPGYDWIFGYPIKGLITKYGGAASHMAIRAAEFSLPAAIGCGEKIFRQLVGEPTIELDCLNHQIKIIK